ncbi:DUF3592 domain-containing protein [Tsukamurella sp. 1534]|uniref:DUF3592 domain-containing protein n=1 Tax=Tsukamurella sp. 1534 TaxID=1151061 RepID=UPI0005932884|nr:DUF3592 domain-containing protein [Tsukamurella sp. 1534]
MSRVVLRRIQWVLLWAAILITVLCTILVLAAWRDDKAIERDLGSVTAEVLSASPTRSTISFYTPDGVNHNPPLGVLYPSDLTIGDRIQVEYNRADPELVRVAGRTAAVAVLPAASVAVGTWLVIGSVMVLLAVAHRRADGDTGTPAQESSPAVPRRDNRRES